METNFCYTKMELDIVITPEGKGRDRIYSITSLQVPNVVTQGKTLEEAKARLKEALEIYFEEMPEEKDKIIVQMKQIECNNMPLISRIFL